MYINGEGKKKNFGFNLTRNSESGSYACMHACLYVPVEWCLSGPQRTGFVFFNPHPVVEMIQPSNPGKWQLVLNLYNIYTGSSD